MPALLKHYGLDLPIYEQETPLVSRTDSLKFAARQRSDTIVRHTRLSAYGAPSLKEALRIADDAFQSVAEKCGALVIPHIWGLYAVENNLERYYEDILRPDPHPELIPSGHVLIAEVPVLKSVSILTMDQHLDALRAVTEYRASRSPGELYWSDADPRQFVNGSSEDDGQSQVWLIDIEPLLHRLNQ